MTTSAGEGIQASPERIILTSEQDTVRLIQLVPEDAESYYALIAYEPAHLSQHGDNTADKYENAESVRASIEHPENPDKHRFGIWDGDVMVGSDNLTPEGDGLAELGSWVGKQHIGKGYAGRGRALLLGFAFDRLGLSEVHCDIVVGNEPSRKSVEKSGFKFVKEFIDNQGKHKWLYVLTREDYRTRGET